MLELEPRQHLDAAKPPRGVEEARHDRRGARHLALPLPALAKPTRLLFSRARRSQALGRPSNALGRHSLSMALGWYSQVSGWLWVVGPVGARAIEFQTGWAIDSDECPTTRKPVACGGPTPPRTRAGGRARRSGDGGGHALRSRALPDSDSDPDSDPDWDSDPDSDSGGSLGLGRCGEKAAGGAEGCRWGRGLQVGQGLPRLIRQPPKQWMPVSWALGRRPHSRQRVREMP
jgi:hypothetical protein